MKKITLIILGSLFQLCAYAQIETPVKWSYAAKKVSSTEAVLFIKATIDPGWHIYSLNIKDGGPVKTSFTFKKSAGYSVIGKAIEPKPVTHFEKSFGMEVSYFEKEVIFKQRIKLKKASGLVKGTLEFMTCNDHKCLPPADVDFTIPVK
jgi:DsbC/DsbD-like thiol-disulfide interchange protein